MRGPSPENSCPTLGPLPQASSLLPQCPPSFAPPSPDFITGCASLCLFLQPGGCEHHLHSDHPLPQTFSHTELQLQGLPPHLTDSQSHCKPSCPPLPYKPTWQLWPLRPEKPRHPSYRHNQGSCTPTPRLSLDPLQVQPPPPHQPPKLFGASSVGHRGPMVSLPAPPPAPASWLLHTPWAAATWSEASSPRCHHPEEPCWPFSFLCNPLVLLPVWGPPDCGAQSLPGDDLSISTPPVFQALGACRK